MRFYNDFFINVADEIGKGSPLTVKLTQVLVKLK